MNIQVFSAYLSTITHYNIIFTINPVKQITKYNQHSHDIKTPSVRNKLFYKTTITKSK